MDARLTVGVIGCGRWGSNHARIFHELPESQLAWVCDLSHTQLERVQARWPEARMSSEVGEVLASEVDAVVIATPASTHHDLAIAALRAGKHLLIEKPLAACVREAEEIVAEGERQDLVAMVGHTFVYNPAVEAMKTILASGELGTIYYIDGTRANLGFFQPDINVMWDLAPHDVSILRFILGEDPNRVLARGYAFVQPHSSIHDVAYLSFHFPSGVQADLRLSWLYPHKVRQYMIAGSRRMLVYDDDEPEQKLLVYDRGVDTVFHGEGAEESSLEYRQGEAVAYPVAWVEPLRRECQHFVRCIREGSEPRSSAREGLQVVRVLEAAQRSLLGSQGWENISW